MDDFADLNRRIESLLREGTVIEIDHGARRVRVESGGLQTDWIRWLAQRTGDSIIWDPPSIGEPGLLFCPSGEPTTGLFLPGVYCDGHDSPSSSPTQHVRVYRDGARLQYDFAAHALTATLPAGANCRASGEDDGAKRMAGNYAAVALAWRYLCEFAGMDPSEGDFPRDLLAEMNGHIAETSADREPWVWIMETVLSEIDGGNYKHPYTFDMVDGEFCLLLRTGHVMDHIAHTSALRDKWNGLPVKSDRVFKAQLKHAGVVVGEKEVERRIYTRRVPYLTPISLERLAGFGLHVSVREDLATDATEQRGRA